MANFNIIKNPNTNFVKISKSSNVLVEFRDIKIENFSYKNKKFPFLKGDQPVEEINDTIFHFYWYQRLKMEDFEKNEVLQLIHHLLFETLIVDGMLVCLGCKTEYEVKEGIPCLLSDEDITEVKISSEREIKSKKKPKK